MVLHQMVGTNSNVRRGRQRFAYRRKDVMGTFLAAAFLLLPCFAPLIAPYPPELQILSERLFPPSSTHLMGTDGLGRDVFSRVLYASQISISVGILAMFSAAVIGMTLGLAAGYSGGWLDTLLMRLTDTLLSFPQLLLIVTLTSLYGRSPTGLIVTLGMTSWGLTARVVRGLVLSIKQREYVMAARAMGSSHIGILFRHILPHILPIVVVETAMRSSWVILLEGSLSFLGLGIQPPDPTWGNMIAEGGLLLRRAWWISFFPGVLLFLCSLTFNFVGDSLRDLLNPRRDKEWF